MAKELTLSKLANVIMAREASGALFDKNAIVTYVRYVTLASEDNSELLEYSPSSRGQGSRETKQ